MLLRSFKFYLISQVAIIGASAQTIENITTALWKGASGDAKYKIYYDLVAPFDNIPCEIKVKVKAGEKSFYTKELTGDAGNLVLPGKKKQITWNHVEDLIHYSGEVSISLEVTPDVKIPTKIKKGKGLTIQLSSAFKTDKTYTIKLFRKGIELAKLNELKISENTIPVALPLKSKVGKKYQLMVSDGEHDYYSNALKVKPKVGNGWKVLPLLAIPAYLIINDYLEDQESLPGPPSIN